MLKSVFKLPNYATMNCVKNYYQTFHIFLRTSDEIFVNSKYIGSRVKIYAINFNLDV